MKQLTCTLGITLFLIVSAYNANGQIILTQLDMPHAGMQIVTLTDGAPTILPGSKGADQTWNFAALKGTTSNTMLFVSPSSTPYSSLFPTANLADSVAKQPGYTFFSSLPDSFSIAGIRQLLSGYSLTVNFAPLLDQIPLPLTYGAKSGRKVIGTAKPIAFSDLGSDSAKGKQYTTYSDTVDAWGSLQLPAGTFTVLRQKHYEYDVDSVFLHYSIPIPIWIFGYAENTKTYQYNWYTNWAGYILVQMTTDSTYSKTESVTYLPNAQGINEVSTESHALVYPNPCTSQINFRYSTHTTMTLLIFDIAGRQISENEVKNGAASLNTSSYSSGVYLYKLSDMNGTVLDRGKFSVR